MTRASPERYSGERARPAGRAGVGDWRISRRILKVDSGTTLSLEDIVLTNGSALDDGGAIYSDGALVLTRVTILNSSSQLSGGALIAYGPTQIDDSEIAYNKADNGGAVYARFPNAPVLIRNTYIHHNEADRMAEGRGGAVFLWDGATLTIQSSRIEENEAKSGGGIYNAFANSAITVQTSRIAENRATGNVGGGIAVFAGPLTIENSHIHANVTSDFGGGVYYDNGGSAAVSRTTISANVAADAGGGAYIRNSTGVVFSNVTISGNSAQDAGGIRNSDSQVSLAHLTFGENFADEVGDSIKHFSNPGRTTTIRNSILETEGTENCHVDAGLIVSEGGNVANDSSCNQWLNKPNDDNSATTLLGPLGMNGGPTPTHVPGPGSDAVDAGISDNAPLLDQRGVLRPQGASVDAGAVEVASCPGGSSLCGDANGNGAISAPDALRALQTSVGSSTCPLWLCDYNGNGSITATDALGILRAAVGLQTTPACPAKWDCHSLG